MMDLKSKYPYIYQSEFEDADASTLEEETACLQEKWRREATLFRSTRGYVKNIDLFAGSQLHDSTVLSVDFNSNCLKICVDDYMFLDSFHIVNSILGLGVPEELIKCPVTLRLDGIRKIVAYKTVYESPESSSRTVHVVPVDKGLPTIKEFLYDEISEISRQSISIGLILGARDGNLVLDIDARSISFEENIRERFSALFDEQNVDIFDALWQARAKRKLGGNIGSFIRIILALRPDMPRDYDILGDYVQSALEMKADDLAKHGKILDAVELYHEVTIASPLFPKCLWKKLGECLFKLKRYAEAMIYVYAVLGYTGGKDIEARFLLAQIWYRLGHTEAAATELQECLKLDPKFEKAIRFIARHKKIQKCIEAWAGVDVDEE